VREIFTPRFTFLCPTASFVLCHYDYFSGGGVVEGVGDEKESLAPPVQIPFLTPLFACFCVFRGGRGGERVATISLDGWRERLSGNGRVVHAVTVKGTRLSMRGL